MNDHLEARLRAADPVKTTDPGEWPPSHLTDLVEATMNDKQAAQRRYWAVPVAAAAIVALTVGGVAVAQNIRSDSGRTVSAAPMQLKVPDSGAGLGNSCIVFSVSVLSEMPVAFSGTVVELGEGTALLDVDHWYRGGSAAQVELENPDVDRIALDGSVTFSAGQRYLVSASDGLVSGCGFTTEWNSDTAAAFDEAFS